MDGGLSDNIGIRAIDDAYRRGFLQRRVNDDGSLNDEARYDFTQARVAFEQALRLNPAADGARFNLSLLLSLLPRNIKLGTKDNSGMELSNLPIGLP